MYTHTTLLHLLKLMLWLSSLPVNGVFVPHSQLCWLCGRLFFIYRDVLVCVLERRHRQDIWWIVRSSSHWSGSAGQRVTMFFFRNYAVKFNLCIFWCDRFFGLKCTVFISAWWTVVFEAICYLLFYLEHSCSISLDTVGEEGWRFWPCVYHLCVCMCPLSSVEMHQ